ncbi:DUF6120 family protein [uncultured Thomasclavelia sp.]|uniref:DUF6120 family protein n=1 Tax=uncultured Thomasclavelia sp. TaxID=3025759 RepID=UPI0025E0B491|nr:DUF6120 family protein [uncultured Thomasclavelia sp.]
MVKANKNITLYKKNLITLMPLRTKKERAYINEYMTNVEEYCLDFTDASYDEIVENFGEPKSVVLAYLKECDENYLLKRINTRDIVKKSLCSIVIIICCLLLIITYQVYMGYLEERNSYVIREEITRVDR